MDGVADGGGRRRVGWRRGGNGGVAHRGCSGRRSGLGDALETTNSTATMVGVRRGERRRGGDAGLGDEAVDEHELLTGAGGELGWLRRHRPRSGLLAAGS